MRLVTLVILPAILLTSSSLASSKVEVAFGQDSYSARYSQGVNLDLVLKTADGTPIDGTRSCRTASSPEAPCTLSVELRAEGSDDVGALVGLDVEEDGVGSGGGVRCLEGLRERGACELE